MSHPIPIPAATGHALAGGWVRFTHVRIAQAGERSDPVPAERLDPAVLARLTAPRPAFAGIDLSAPRIMGVLNVTPDSFSDGGRHLDPEAARRAADAMARADVLDIGGESTRPGAVPVPADREWTRIRPVLQGLHGRRISVDTRKASVARAAVAAGATVVNDVSGLTHDPDMAATVADIGAPLILMHGPGDPATMQHDPRYADVLVEVLDWLETRLRAAEAAGIPRTRIAVDPGIGFGKTLDHNLALLRDLTAFHGLGCPVLLGVSRKGFIGRIGDAPEAAARMPGTLAVTLHAVAQGVQLHRVHDVAEIAQGLALWRAVAGR